MKNIANNNIITLFGIPNCDTVKKARTWLDENSIPFIFHNFKKDGLSKSDVELWLTKIDLTILINRKGTTWRALSEEQKMSADDLQSAISLMIENPSIIKRPVLQIISKQDLQVSVGFKPEQFTHMFNVS